MKAKILVGDVLERLRGMGDASVQCVVTSPPYWGLRDYGAAGQIGLEASPFEYLKTMVDVFREVRRVLRENGTCWVNMGDSYAGSRAGHEGFGTSTLDGNLDNQRQANRAARVHLGKAQHSGARELLIVDGLKPKDMVGMPWMLAFALRADGWYLRQDIIWSKPNPMPESVRDRCTKAHEYLFLLSKSERYHCNMEAIAEPCMHEADAPRNRWDTKDYQIPGQKPQKRVARSTNSPKGWDTTKGEGGHGFHRQGRSAGNKTHKSVAAYEAGAEEHRTAGGLLKVADVAYSTRNKRSVWEIATQAFAEAHFATFPEKLVEPCIMAGSKEGDLVMDPFCGSGTTGVVALRYAREFVGVELNPKYAAMAERRIRQAAPLLNVVEVDLGGAPANEAVTKIT